jgi:ribosomal protein S18 acetylase RimI-like enzyme
MSPHEDTIQKNASAEIVINLPVTSNDDEAIRVEVLTIDHLQQACQVMKEGFGTKRFLACIPMTESLKAMTKRYSNYPAEKFALGAVAVSNSKVLGFVQMTNKDVPMYPAGLHVCETGEMYIETVAVSATARGKGVGSLLLDWCEQTARSYKTRIYKLTLCVINGNRAIGLYERFGFQGKTNDDACDDCCEALIICCLLGRPYGCCNPKWGATDMVKSLN